MFVGAFDELEIVCQNRSYRRIQQSSGFNYTKRADVMFENFFLSREYARNAAKCLCAVLADNLRS